MVLEKIHKALVALDLGVSDIDAEYPKKFYVDITNLKEVAIILSIMNYFDYHTEYHYAFTDEYHKKNGYNIDYYRFAGLENVKGIVIGQSL